jgi:hypothetical protein
MSGVMAVIAFSSTVVWRVALNAWVDTSHPRYDAAEPFIAMWNGALWLAILLLACAGAIVDRGWRWLVALAAILISLLGWLLIDALVGGLRDGMVSSPGLLFGAVSAGQWVFLVGWLAWDIWRGRRIG